MPLFDTLKDWWQDASPGYLVHDLPPLAVHPVGDVQQPCVAGLHYFRLWLAEMRLARDKEWFGTRHPVVHALVRLRFGDVTIELPTIAGPLTLPGLDQAHLGDVVQLDHALTPLLPYNGGVVEIAAGLVALEGTNLMSEFVRAIDAVSGVLAQPPLSTALAAVGPVTSAVQTLFGAANGRQHLGVHASYAGEQMPQALHAGYVAVVRRDGAAIDPARLSVEQGRLRLDGQVLAGADYMLFRIERMDESDDWDSLLTIARPFRDALAALSHRDMAMAEALVRRALLETYTSPDLTRADRPRVCAEIKRTFKEARDAGLGLERTPATLADAMAGAVPAATSLQQQPATLAAVLEL
ncbi:MAG TPA: hypothetical protein VMF13_22735 [Luteitalea sp.]|nr:hypothetical protein [Luteitalea sp.]